jgi:enoyl-CoA hydratase/carnithine racemase
MFVRTETIDEGITKIVLANPKMNLLSNQVKRELKDTFTSVSHDVQVRVILFESEGPHFCCGADLKEFPERIENKTAGDVWDQGHAMLHAIVHAPQPTVACIQGNALGGGAELAVAFDFRMFADDAQIGFPEVGRGIFPGNGGLERTIDITGVGNAMKLMLTGNVIPASEALSLGLATGVLPSSLLHSNAYKLANQLAALPAAAIQAVKQAVIRYSNSRNDFSAAGRELFRQVHETEDVKEGVRAFIEKRKPVFKHR